MNKSLHYPSFIPLLAILPFLTRSHLLCSFLVLLRTFLTPRFSAVTVIISYPTLIQTLLFIPCNYFSLIVSPAWDLADEAKSCKTCFYKNNFMWWGPKSFTGFWQMFYILHGKTKGKFELQNFVCTEFLNWTSLILPEIWKRVRTYWSKVCFLSPHIIQDVNSKEFLLFSLLLVSTFWTTFQPKDQALSAFQVPLMR